MICKNTLLAIGKSVRVYDVEYILGAKQHTHKDMISVIQ